MGVFFFQNSSTTQKSILVFTFNAKSILSFINYMIISSIHNITPKSSILFTDLCTRDFCNWQDFIHIIPIFCLISYRRLGTGSSYYDILLEILPILLILLCFHLNKRYYEWAKRTKFLLAVLYGSACRHLIGS